MQHHHAHVASLLAETGLPLDTPVIGVAFDGTGYGSDGKIWGGEVLLVKGAGMAWDGGTVLPGIIEDLHAGVPTAQIATGFDDAIARWVFDSCLDARDASGLTLVALTGGVFQNMTLLRRSVDLLRATGFEVLVHRKVPANDGGLALGQAYLAAAH